MTQIATVERILNAGYAEISVARQSACAHDCAECAGCGVTGVSIQARAANPIGAEPGDRVVVRSDTKKLLRIAALVYLLPMALFVAGYCLAALVTPLSAVRGAAAAAGFAAGLLPAFLYDRRARERGGLSFTIVRFF